MRIDFKELKRKFMLLFSECFLRQLAASFWVVTRHISLLLLLVAIYLLVIFVNQQGIDILSAVVYSGKYSFWTFVSVITFHTTLWFCANFLLHLKKISYDESFTIKNEEAISFLSNSLPAIVGAIPTLALFFKEEFYSNNLWFIPALFAFVIILPIIFIVFSEDVGKIYKNIKWLNRINNEEQSFKSLIYFRGARISIVLFLAVIIGLFILSLKSIEWRLAVEVGPFAVLNFGLSFFTLIVSLILYLNIPGRRPFVIWCLLLYILFSIWNDNSEIRTIDIENKRPSLEEDFTQWVKGAVRDTVLVSKFKIPQKKSKKVKATTEYAVDIPIIMIATEGGGIRALSWTGMIMNNLESKYPGIHRNIYAVSGVSGGGVGATFYTSYLHDNLAQNGRTSDMKERFKKSISQDFLSDLLSAYLFQDNLQNFLPFAVPNFNRSRQLEDAWSKSFLTHLKSLTFEKRFTDLYNDRSLQIPRLFLNGVLSESGQKTIVSYPILSKQDSNIFMDDIDVISAIGKDIPVKTAASLCARFPYLTSGGLIREFGGAEIGHIVDGGYKENTGLETVWQLLLRLRPVMQRLQLGQKQAGNISYCIRFQPIVLFIKNSMILEDIDIRSAGILHDLVIPPYAFSNTSDRRTSIIDALTKEVFEEYVDKGNKIKTCIYHKIDLDRKSARGKRLPLGWYFSDSSFQFVDHAARNFFTDNNEVTKKMNVELGKYFKTKK